MYSELFKNSNGITIIGTRQQRRKWPRLTGLWARFKLGKDIA